jgi:hypothetical protein
MILAVSLSILTGTLSGPVALHGFSQFTSVFTTENTTNMPSKGNSPFKPMKDIKISEKGVEKELNRLNPCKATGPDEVPVRILKETANIITPILTKIYQQSINTGQIPEDWKHANIVPIFKKGDRSKPFGDVVGCHQELAFA